jgi:ribulose-5-phosphate 4-epimerase/fuculose-1-phosphate aldolase
MATQIASEPRRRNIDDAEWAARVDLAAAYRLVARRGWDDLIYTHISMRVPGTPDHFLINPFGLSFAEVTASNLVKIDHDGNIIGDATWPVNQAGFVIHSAVHAARPDVNCVMHTHTETGMAISMMKGGLQPLSQHAMMFYKRVGYHPFEGVALDMDERSRLTADLGSHDQLILENHGFLTCGRTVGEAYVRMFYMEKAGAAQLRAMATGAAIVMPPPEVCARTADQLAAPGTPVGEKEWPALLRELDREDPSYRS